MPTATPAPALSIAGVKCNLHRVPSPLDCTRCHDAEKINLHLLHERGQCGGSGLCEWCPPPSEELRRALLRLPS